MKAVGFSRGVSDGEMMSASIEEFLSELASHPGTHRFGRATGTVRFDFLADGAIHHRFVDISPSRITVSEEDRPADCVIHGDKALLDAAAQGERNLTSAWLRRDLVVDGRVELFRLLERLFPASAAARDPRDLVPTSRPEAERG